ncbi:MAG: hypothetical protein ACREQY_04000 [Candidatus Binatia bacterium]
MRAAGYANVLVIAVPLAIVSSGCSSGFRNCRSYVDMADREVSSGSPTQIVQGLVMYPLSPIACGIALAASPLTEVTERDRKVVARERPPVRQADAAPDAPTAPDSPAPVSLETEILPPESGGTLEKVEE